MVYYKNMVEVWRLGVRMVDQRNNVRFCMWEVQCNPWNHTGSTEHWDEHSWAPSWDWFPRTASFGPNQNTAKSRNVTKRLLLIQSSTATLLVGSPCHCRLGHTRDSQGLSLDRCPLLTPSVSRNHTTLGVKLGFAARKASTLCYVSGPWWWASRKLDEAREKSTKVRRNKNFKFLIKRY